MGTMLAVAGGTVSARSHWQPSSVACIGPGEDVSSESMTGSGYESTKPGDVDETDEMEPEYEGTEYVVPSDDGDEHASGVE